MMVLHGMAYSGAYANTSWPGFQPFGYQTTDSWSRIQPAWRHLSDIIGYLGRTQHVLKTGIPRVDLAIFDSRTEWEASVIYDSDDLQQRGAAMILCFSWRRVLTILSRLYIQLCWS